MAFSFIDTSLPVSRWFQHNTPGFISVTFGTIDYDFLPLQILKKKSNEKGFPVASIIILQTAAPDRAGFKVKETKCLENNEGKIPAFILNPTFFFLCLKISSQPKGEKKQHY